MYAAGARRTRVRAAGAGRPVTGEARHFVHFQVRQALEVYLYRAR